MSQDFLDIQYCFIQLDVCMRLPALVIMDSILAYSTEKPAEPPNDDDTGKLFWPTRSHVV